MEIIKIWVFVLRNEKFIRVWDRVEFDLNKSEDIEKIQYLLKSEDILIRCDTVEGLAEHITNPKILNILINMINDKNYLVRCEVCDALFNSEEEIVLEKLLLRLKKEKKSLVRMHIVSAVCNMVRKNKNNDRYINTLKILFNKEKSKRVIIAYLVLFYSTSKDKKYLNKALSYINDGDYHIRCNVINLINDVLDVGNTDIIVKAYNNRLKREKAFCVTDSIKRNVEYISSDIIKADEAMGK